MKSADPKVLHPAGGLPLIEHVLAPRTRLRPATTVVVVGHLADRVKTALGKRLGLRFALQQPQLGTGHALLQAEPHLAGASGTVVLLSGDVPLLRPATLRALVATHRARGAAATVLTARVAGPHEYGRIVREDGAHRGDRGAQGRDARAARGSTRSTAGSTRSRWTPLFAALEVDRRRERAGGVLPAGSRRAFTAAQGLTVETVLLDDSREILGVNSRRELADVTAILKTTRNDELMAAGVSIVDPASAWIGPDVVDRRRHRDPPERVSRRADAHRSGLRDPRGRPHRRLRPSTTAP